MIALRRDLATAAPALALLLVGVVAALAGLLLQNRGFFSYSMDDPYIHLVLAEQLAQGHYGINPGEPSAPCSSIVWPFLLALGARTPFFSYLPFVINLVAAVGALLAAHATVRWSLGDTTPRQRLAVAAVTALFIPACNLVGHVFTGLEHLLQTGLSLAAVAGVVRREREGRMSAWLVPVLVLGPLVRYENLALSLPVLVLLFARGERRAALVGGAAIVTLVGGFSVFLYTQGLGLLPSSVLLKSTRPRTDDPVAWLVSNLRSGLDLRGAALLVIGGGAAAFALASGRRADGGGKDRGIGLLVLAGTGMHLLASGFRWYGRYSVYLGAAVLAMAIHLVRGPFVAVLERARRGVVPVAAGLVFAGVCLLTAQTLVLTIGGSNNVYSQQYQMHRFVTEYHRAPVAVNDIGWVSYQNDAYTLDLWGLGSHQALRHRRAGDPPAWMDELARRRGVELVMIYDAWFNALPAGWIKVGHLHTYPPIYTVSRADVSFYATNAGAAARLREALFRFRETLPPGATFVFADEGEPYGSHGKAARSGTP